MIDYGSFIRTTAPSSPVPGKTFWFDANSPPGALYGWSGSWTLLSTSGINIIPPLPGLTVRADSIPLIANSVTTLRFSNLTVNGSGDVFISSSAGIPTNTDSLSEGSTNLYFTGERAQDAVQSMFVVNTADIAFTYSDANNLLSTQVKSSAITFNKIQNAAQASVLLGAGSTGSGAPYSEITLGSNLSMSGTTIYAASGSSLVSTGFNLTVREEDASPTITSVTVLRFPNGSITVNGSGDISIAVNSVGGGSGALSLVEHKTVTANTTSITFSGLNGDNDGVYLLQGRVLVSSGAVSVRLLPNGSNSLSTLKSYLSSRFTGGGGNDTQSSVNWLIANPNSAIAGVTFRLDLFAKRDPNGVGAHRTYNGTESWWDSGGGNQTAAVISGTWTDTSANLTSLGIDVDVANRLGNGSEFWLYKYAQS